MHLTDHWGETCIPSGGYALVKDPIGRRNGKQPRKEMQDLLNRTVQEARELISNKLVLQNKLLTLKDVQQVVKLLSGAVAIVYPMKLPPHDVIRMEFENVEDLEGTQASLMVIDPAAAQLWFCGKEMYRNEGKTVADYVGKVESCKVRGEKNSSFPNHFSYLPGNREIIEERSGSTWKGASNDRRATQGIHAACVQAAGRAEKVGARR